MVEIIKDDNTARLKISDKGPIDRFLIMCYHDQSIEVNFNKFVEKEFSNYILKSRYHRDEEYYFIDFRSEQKMTEFLLKYQ